MNLRIDLEDIDFIGGGLDRPECVLATAAGNLYTADWRGGVARTGPDGKETLYLASDPPFPLKPNGIALCRDGSFLLAHLGDEGGVYRLHRDGRLDSVITRVDGVDLPATNFVMVDDRDRIWATVSTRRSPRALGYRPDVDDGFIVLMDDKGARIVADGLGYTNEIALDDSGGWLYVNETFGRRTARFRVAPHGDLTDRETITTYGAGTYPDGLAFDAEGCFWVTSIVSNRVIRVSPDGHQTLVLEDVDPDHLDAVEDAFQSGTMDRPHLDKVKSRRLRNISSLAFGGPDLKTACLGCLLGDAIARFRSPVAGRPPVHWHFDG